MKYFLLFLCLSCFKVLKFVIWLLESRVFSLYLSEWCSGYCHSSSYWNYLCDKTIKHSLSIQKKIFLRNGKNAFNLHTYINININFVHCSIICKLDRQIILLVCIFSNFYCTFVIVSITLRTVYGSSRQWETKLSD